MRALQNEKLIYKMYKKGRFWVFAGITVATLNVNLLNGQAATTDQSTSSSSNADTESSTVASTASELSDSSVTLSGSTSSTTNSTNESTPGTTDTATSKADTTTSESTNGSDSTTTESTDTTKQTTDTSSSQTSDKQATEADQTTGNDAKTSTESSQSTTTDKQTTSGHVTDSTTTGATTSSDVKDTTTTDTSNNVTASTDTTPVTDSTPTPATNSTSVADDTTTVGDMTAANNVTTATVDDLPTTDTTADATASATLTNALQAASVQGTLSKKLMMRAAAVTAATIVASGDFSKEVTGGSTWTLDSNGLLTISAGAWGATTGSNSWYSKRTLVKSIVIEGPVTVPSDISWTFFGESNLTSISGLAYIDTSNVTNMDRLFSGTAVSDFSGVANWDTSNVTDMNMMFASTKITTVATIPVESWNVSKVTNFTGMFSSTTLESIDLSGWTLNATANISIASLFSAAANLVSVNLSGWQVGNVTSAQQLFSGDTSLVTADLTGWTLTNTTSMNSMFKGTENLKSVDISGWDTSKVTDMSFIFSDTAVLPNIDLSKLNTSNVTNMQDMFSGSDLTGADITSFDTSKVTTTKEMFKDATLAGIDLTNLKTQNVVDMTSMFEGTDLTGIDLTNLNTSATKLMSKMFASTTNTTLDLSSFDTSNVKDMSYMFTGAAVTSLDLTKFDTSKVTTMYAMFEDTKMTQIDLSGFNTSSLTVMKEMFTRSAFTSLDLSNFDWSNITSVEFMFTDASKLSTLKLNPAAYLKTTITNMFGTVYSSDADLPDVPTTDNYTGLWVDDNGQTYTSAQLMAAYSNTEANDFTTPLTYTWQIVTSNSSLTAQDSTIIAGPTATWNAKDNVAELKDVDGNVVDLTTLDTDAIAVTGDTVDPTKTGSYHVTLSYTDSKGIVREATATVTVVASQSVLVGKDISINQGATWQAGDSVDTTNTLNAAGNQLSATELATITGSNLDTSKTGVQTVTLSYTDAAGNVRTTTATVNVVASQATLVTKDINIVKGANATWNLLDNVVSATDFKGDTVDNLSSLKITADTTPDLTKAGNYPVTLTYTDSEGNQHTYTVNVTVTASQASLVGQDTTIVMGPNASWQLTDNLASATDIDGNALTAEALAKVTASATPDLTKAGDTLITLTYTDAAGNQVTTTATVHVVASAAQVNVHDATIVMGPNATWNAKDNLDSVIQANGDTIAASDVVLENNVKMVNSRVMSIMYSYLRADGTTVTVAGQVDLTKVGDNTITYTYTDSQGNTTTATATVHVVTSQAGITANDSTLIAGPNTTWSAKDNLTAVQDENGQTIDLSKVTTTGTVNPAVPGTYQVTYHYTDSQGNQISKTITVTVAATKASLNVKNSTLNLGATWNASDNIVSLTDATGQAVDINQVTITGNVDTMTAGTYTVTYQYTDAAGNVYTATATVTITDPTNGNNGNGDTIDPDENQKPTKPTDGGTTSTGGGTTGTTTEQQPGKAGTTTNQGATINSQAAQIRPTNLVTAAQPKAASTDLTTTSTSKGTVKATDNLPQTDEATTQNASALGMALLALTGVVSWLGLGRKRRHD
ncbi:BspA family leucine-rich repeat surface protein [Lactiplantibacillus daowaiensis]|uniref:BspA family leucine-rich repeat surface protein n=1 Tax=Lactiplantibacillus daowaiensis TaxID=2559918 RepID=A0ABW1S2X0_9LACO|nr:BspA family leucine-rich repeat surface protein [Lactiplantibacillus daowaiensis]